MLYWFLSSIGLSVHDAPNTPDDVTVTVTVRESSGGAGDEMQTTLRPINEW